MRTEASANPVANVRDRFDIEARLFANLANNGLHRRLPRLEGPAGQLPAEEIASDRQQDLARRTLTKDHRLGDHQRA
jgi:hypothetical protein